MLKQGTIAFIILCFCLLDPVPTLSAPLHEAAKSGDLALVNRVLSRGTDINLHDDDNGETPLFYAALTDHNDVVDLLLVRGADVHVIDSKDRNIREAPAMTGNVDAARLFKVHVGDINRAEGYGAIPLDFSISHGQRTMLHI